MSGMTLNMEVMTSLRDAVGKCLAELGKKYDNMLVMTADVDTSSRIQAFKEAFPDRCYNVGIAEQCLMSTAAGLAHEGFKPLTFAFAPFASMRCYEQVRTDICYTKLPVIIIGNGAGYSNGASGCTHCGLEDSALMVACNNMTVIEPGDPAQMVKVLEAAMELNAPVYIRLGREATTSLYAEDVKYEIGKALIPREGNDGAFVCTGIMVHFAMEAAKRIREELGREIRVVDMHTVKPLDRDAVIAAAGGAKKDILEKSISPDLELVMEQRATYERGVGETQDIAITANDVYNVIVAVPIITDGDVTGCVAFVGEEENASADEVAVKLCQTAAQFLSKRLGL